MVSTRDDQNGRDVNNRNRYFLRGQLLIEPSDALSVRLIADYTIAEGRMLRGDLCRQHGQPVYRQSEQSVHAADAASDQSATISSTCCVILGQPLGRVQPRLWPHDFGQSRTASLLAKPRITAFPARSTMILAAQSLTSITAYRQYRSGQASDTDYSEVDILYRAPSDDAYRQFHTFTQELRLQGEAFDGKLDWLVGGFYANEKLTVRTICASATNMAALQTVVLFPVVGLRLLYQPEHRRVVSTPVLRPTVFGALACAGPLRLWRF